MDATPNGGERRTDPAFAWDAAGGKPATLESPLVPGAPLSHRIGGMPGPIWTMVAWSTLTCLLLLVSILLPLTTGTGFPTVTTACAVILGASALIGAIGRSRLPRWWIYVNTVVWIGVTCWLMWPSAPIEIAVLSFGFVICAVYVGYWMPRAAVLSYATLWSVASLAVLMIRGRIEETALVWLTAVAVSVALAVLINALTVYLRHQATHDSLTGLLNRVGLLASVSGGLPDAIQGAQPMGLAVIDLDGFKELNDRQGHVAGDAVLRQVASLLGSGLRERDVIARFGGDEFVVLLPRTELREAAEAVERAGQAFPIGWSYGLAEWTSQASFDEALAAADQRMYEMKADRRRT